MGSRTVPPTTQTYRRRYETFDELPFGEFVLICTALGIFYCIETLILNFLILMRINTDLFALAYFFLPFFAFLLFWAIASLWSDTIGDLGFVVSLMSFVFVPVVHSYIAFGMGGAEMVNPIGVPGSFFVPRNVGILALSTVGPTVLLLIPGLLYILYFLFTDPAERRYYRDYAGVQGNTPPPTNQPGPVDNGFMEEYNRLAGATSEDDYFREM